MKTWRERIAEARARGKFTAADRHQWFSLFTCPAAEVATNYGIGTDVRAMCLWTIGHQFGPAMKHRNFDEAERLLNEIEDRALEIKRARLDSDAA